MTLRQFAINVCRYLSMVLVIYIIFSFAFVIIELEDNLEMNPILKSNFFKPIDRNPNQKIIAIISPVRRGEYNQAKMIRESAEKLGHLTYIYYDNDVDSNMFIPAKFLNEIILEIMNYYIKPDFHFVVSFHVVLDVPKPNMMYISIPKEYYTYKVAKDFPDVQNFNNFIDINLVNSNEDWLGELLRKKINLHYGLVGVPANVYRSAKRDRLLFYGSLWGRKTDNLFAAYTKLAGKDYMWFIKHPMVIFSESAHQKFTKKAKTLDNLQELLHQYGIGLCAHSKFHNDAGVPSSRIFEIISSGAIAISDNNSFVKKYFGDAVLFYDQNASSDEIFNQIDSHVKWIKQNPKLAEDMAKKAHQIFLKQFTTERFVVDMIDFYETKLKME